MPGPFDAVLNALLYVPVGIAVSVKESFPELAARGRERVASARTVGQFAVQQGHVQASRLFDRVQGGETSSETTSAPAAPTVAAADRPSAATGAPSGGVATSGPAGASLAVPGYDSLSASQVLPRLDGLTPDELEAVRVYEAAHRGRKTILTRITQLQSS
jgi:hypothetical protein